MIHVGPAGWTHPGLQELWPKGTHETTGALGFLAAQFGCVEVDATEHVLPRDLHVRRWTAAFADHPGGRMLVRVPSSLLDLSRAPAARAEDAAAFTAALAPLARRQRLGALVAALPDPTLHGPAEIRALSGLTRSLPRVPLALVAAHASWRSPQALDSLRGLGWSLAEVAGPESWHSAVEIIPPTGPIAVVRLTRPGIAPPPLVAELARRARALEAHADAVYVITDNGRGGGPPAAPYATAVEVRYVLAGEQPVNAWPGLVRAFPHLQPLVRE